MEDGILSQPPPETVADYEAVLDQYLAEIQRLNEQMRNDQADIDRLKAESETLKAEMQKLREETDALRAETRSILARLRAA